MVIKFSLRDLEKELIHLLKVYATGEDFDFKYPQDVEANEFGYVFGNIVDVALFDEPFYFQIRFGESRLTEYMQVGIRLLIGDVKKDVKLETLYPLLNKLNKVLLFAKAVLNDDEDPRYVVIDREFSAATINQVGEDIDDFFGDLIDEDVSPIVEEILQYLE